MPWLELEMANDETDGGIAHTPAASSTEDSDELEEEQVDSLTTAASDVKAGEEEVDERNLTLLQRKFRNAWFDNAESSPVSGFSFEPTPLSPPRTPQPSTMGGVTSVDEEGMFTVRLK
ncbi:uncharacterized protein LOC134194252 isoform X2 [Corticium candelabrum]|uniref:uncharacterized protein LOC134194252 isoform X2 n=1 Tax=Corticium candelabrum TaxID=121492 RepID=UPI002E26D974|nr:uncharacterized protein LOC134194252 isoform X2 [Corticium candelabrum]